jgi:protein-L-isoaspartate(D-aspartate) O-methyltransferase
MVSVMTELLALKGDEKVLEIGTGSGYQSAVLAELTKEVFTIERIESLAHKAEELFHSLGYTNIRGKVGDGTLGWIEEAPFSRIIITAGAPVIPETLKDQLSEDGAILAPVGNRFSQQLLLITRHRETFVEEYHTPCVFVPLIGEFGWKKEEL